MLQRSNRLGVLLWHNQIQLKFDEGLTGTHTRVLCLIVYFFIFMELLIYPRISLENVYKMLYANYQFFDSQIVAFMTQLQDIILLKGLASSDQNDHC